MDLRQLRRSRTDRYIGGVGSGIGAALGIDPIVVRVVLVVLTFFGGAGLIVYAGAWLLLPEEDDEHGIVPVDARSRALLLGIVLALAAVAVVGVGHLHLPWPFWVAACLALLLLTQREYQVGVGWWGIVPHLRFSPRHPRSETTAPAPENVATMAAAPADASPAASAPAPPPAPPGDSDPWGTPRLRWPEPPPAPPRPAKPGPVLFWVTLALVVLAEGVVGTVDVSGASVVGPVYPAVALGVVAAMLLLSAFWGRGGGIVLLGLLATFALVVSAAAHEAGWSGRPQDIHVDAGTSPAGRIHPAYSFGTGRLTVDLTRASDLQQLTGRTIRLTGRVGRIEVDLPDGVCPHVNARVSGPGRIVFDGNAPSDLVDGHDGFGFDVHRTLAGPAGCVPFTLDAQMGIGVIEIGRQ